MPASLLKATARRALRELCRWRLLLRSRPLPLSDLGTVLILAPHSDDETLGCGALLVELAARAQTVHVAYFTDSAGSHRNLPGIDPHALAVQRQAEATAAMKLAGIPAERLHWLGAPDGRLKDLTATESTVWQDRLRQLLGPLRPTAVFLPARADGSSEHEAMFRLFSPLVSALAPRPRILEFPVWSWWNPRFLWPQLRSVGRVWRHPSHRRAAAKRAMLACYQSQTQALRSAAEPPLSAEFLAAFATSHEFFFETKLPS